MGGGWKLYFDIPETLHNSLKILTCNQTEKEDYFQGIPLYSLAEFTKGVLQSGDNDIMYFQGTREKRAIHLEFYTLTNYPKLKT